MRQILTTSTTWVGKPSRTKLHVSYLTRSECKEKTFKFGMSTLCGQIYDNVQIQRVAPPTQPKSLEREEESVDVFSCNRSSRRQKLDIMDDIAPRR